MMSLEKKLEENTSLLAVQTTVTNNLLAEKLRLEDAISKIEDELDDLHQYSRRNCLLIHGVNEQVNENTSQIALDTFSKNLKINISPNDITRTHRIGKKRVVSVGLSLLNSYPTNHVSLFTITKKI